MVSQARIASRLVWLPSMTIRSGPTVPLQRLEQEPFRGGQIAPLA
jgi:hypothetical protein